MRRFIGIAGVCVAGVFAFGGNAQADHWEKCIGVVTTIGEGDATFYVADRTEGRVTINHWLYKESNGIPGLQPGGNTVLLDEADNCQGGQHDTNGDGTIDENDEPYVPDTAIF